MQQLHPAVFGALNKSRSSPQELGLDGGNNCLVL